MIPESNEKNEERKQKQMNIAETWGTLDEAQLQLLSWVAHTSMMKGRVLEQMRMDGKTADDIAEKLGTDVGLVEKILLENPYDVLTNN